MRECHENIHRLTSQVPDVQERMIFLNDSGEFQEVELNFCGQFSRVPSQPARIPSSRSMISCEQRLPPETWNHSGLQENVFANPRSTLESSQILYQGILPFMIPCAAGEAPDLKGGLVAREGERIGSTIPMPTFARRPPTMSSSIPVDIQQSSMVGQHRQSEFQFGKFPPPLFIMLEDMIQEPSDYLF